VASPSAVSPSKILCVGRNYAAHARELGHRPSAEPLIFMKPPSSVTADGDPIVVPPGVGRVDFEGEIAFVVGRRARRVKESEALDHLSAVVPLNDVTCRDLQKEDGQWARAKGFDTFCPVGSPVPLEDVELEALRVETRVNGELMQDGSFSDAIYPLPYLVTFLSRIMTLEPGDLIATGTPAGVAPIVPWDEVEVTIPGVGSVRSPVRSGRGAPWPFPPRRGST
jgi:2-keto-4-pentenoate hydratase/2-oxohepta-3-ene-1,7-dioic acid hydratase in catechol pathway